MDNRIFIDTNILMYAVGGEHPLKKPCLNILRRASEGEFSAVTDTEVFQEVAYRYFSQKKWPLAMEILKDYEELFDEILSVDRHHLKLYYQLLNDYDSISPRDAIHIAVMEKNGLREIYTADKAFKQIPFLKVLKF